MPDLLILYCVYTLVCMACMGVAASSAGRSARPLRIGRRLLGVYAATMLPLLANTSHDWVHLLWSVVYPTCGMFTCAGLMLLRTWPRDRALQPRALFGSNGAVVSIVWLAAIGVVPAALANAVFDPFPAGRASGSTFEALVDVGRHGFGGQIPELMSPVAPYQVERGLGSPPRFVSVAMGTSLVAAVAMLAFVALAFVGRAIASTPARWTLWLLAPVVIGILAAYRIHELEEALWWNEPWLVRAYGPTIASAVVAAAALLVAVALDGRRARRAASERTASATAEGASIRAEQHYEVRCQAPFFCSTVPAEERCLAPYFSISSDQRGGGAPSATLSAGSPRSA